MGLTFDTFNDEWARRLIGRKSTRGIDGYLGIVVTELEAGRLVAEMEVTDDLITVMGNMHGGCLSALCDHVLGVVMYPVMPSGFWAATTEFKVNLVAPVTHGVCKATSEIVKSEETVRPILCPPASTVTMQTPDGTRLASERSASGSTRLTRCARPSRGRPRGATGSQRAPS